MCLAAQSVFAMVSLFSVLAPSNEGRPYVIVSAKVDGVEEKTTIQMDESQRLLVVLPWQATGYTWRVSQYQKAFLEVKQLDENAYQQLVNEGVLKKMDESPGIPGSVEKKVFEFHPLSRGTTYVELQYVRPWETAAKPAKRLFLTIEISGLESHSQRRE